MGDVQIEQAGTGTHVLYPPLGRIVTMSVTVWDTCIPTRAFSWDCLDAVSTEKDVESTQKLPCSLLPADEPSLHCRLLQQVCDFEDILLLQSSFSCGSQGSFPILYLATLCRELGRDCTSVAKFGGNQHPFSLQGQPINHNLRSRDTRLSCPCCGNKIVDRAGQASVQIITATPTVPACDWDRCSRENTCNALLQQHSRKYRLNPI